MEANSWAPQANPGSDQTEAHTGQKKITASQRTVQFSRGSTTKKFTQGKVENDTNSPSAARATLRLRIATQSGHCAECCLGGSCPKFFSSKSGHGGKRWGCGGHSGKKNVVLTAALSKVLLFGLNQVRTTQALLDSDLFQLQHCREHFQECDRAATCCFKMTNCCF